MSPTYGGAQDDDTEHKVNGRWHELCCHTSAMLHPGIRRKPMSYPSSRRIRQVKLGSIVGEISDQDTQVYRAGECTCAKATYRGRGDFGQVNRTNDDCLTNADAGEETTKVDRGHAPVVAHEDGYADKPENTKLAGGPQPTKVVAGKEGTTVVSQYSFPSMGRTGLVQDLQKSTRDTPELNHR